MDGAPLSALEFPGLALRVRDRESMARFYRDALGLDVVRDDGGELVLTTGDKHFHLHLLHDPGAVPRPLASVGLYHFALRLPDRAALGRVVRRLGERGVRFEGAADHGVSEAVYLRDPERNGIELYWDRPVALWPREGDQLAMRTEPLDLRGLLRLAPRSGPLDPATRVGHIHLHVPDLAGAEAFFAGDLGLRVTQRTYPGALFFAAGDYHHHVGANTWAGRRTAPEGATGLVEYLLRVPGAVLDSLEARLRRRGRAYERAPDGALLLRDPAGIRVRISRAEGSAGGSRSVSRR